MKKSTTSAAVVPAAIIEDAWQEVGASFERFCLTTGLATLASMLEEDATQVCGARYDRADGRDGHRWGKTTGKVGFHGGKVEFRAAPAYVAATAARSPYRVGRRRCRRTCWASGRST